MSDLLRVLLVEDNPGDADLIVEMLPMDGPVLFEVESVARLSDALERARAGRFDIILLDLGLPDSDGLATLRAMRRQASNLPIIVLTGNKDEQVALASIQEGVQDFLVKGQTDENLLARSIKYSIERKRAEEKLRASEAKLRQLYESMMDAYCRVDMSDRIVDFNTAFVNLLGYSEEELRSLTFADITPPRWNAIQSMMIEQQVMTCGYSDLYEKEYLRKDGTLVPIELRTNLIKDDDGRPSGMWAIIRDITERRKLEEQLRQAQKMEAIGTLAGGIAHEFNNILTAIICYGSILKSKLATDANLIPKVDALLHTADRAAVMVRSLLSFSRKQESDLKPMDLNELISREVELLREIVREDIELKVSLADGLPAVMADHDQLEQVLFNLVKNAQDAMPRGGMISISIALVEMDREFNKIHGFGEPGRYAVITFSDSGEGMDDETQKKIFEPFFTTKEVGKGTGLGLAVVYGIIKQHEGFMNVYSERGSGTIFRIYLPIISAEVQREE